MPSPNPRNLISTGLLVIVVSAIGTACGRSPFVGCPGWVRDAVVVEVRDAATGAPAAEGASGWVRDGDYVDSLRISAWEGGDPASAHQLSAATERPGRYEVVVQKDGYREWRRSGVRVGRTTCGVEPVNLHAQLERLS